MNYDSKIQIKRGLVMSIIAVTAFMLQTQSASAQVQNQIQLQIAIDNPTIKITPLALSGYIPNTQSAPVITVASTTINESHTYITWNMDKLSRSKFYFDTKPLVVEEALGPQYEPTVRSGTYLVIPEHATTSAVDLFHLTPHTTYYYFIQSTDKLGNVSVTPQLTFTTP
jgi:hypothetical protein